ncbi:MAG: inositol monophosphatase family protein [Planctomycetota bacterium]
MTTTHDYRQALALAIDAALAGGELLREEFHRDGGPRGHGGHAEIDAEVELLVRTRLLEATPWSFLGEERGAVVGEDPSHTWIVDPNDGTVSYLKGARGSAVSISLLREGLPVLGVVYAPLAPDDEGDLFAWAEGCGPVTRNGHPLDVDLSDAKLEQGAVVLVSQDGDRAPEANARCVAPPRYIAMPSIAYRLALVAAGEGVAAVSLNGPVGWDYAAGHALLRGAGGVLVDGQGKPITYTRDGRSACAGGRCFGGAPAAVAELVKRPWSDVFTPARDRSASVLVTLERGRALQDVERLRRAQGCLLGQLAGDALGSAVEFMSTAKVRALYPDGLRDMIEPGPVWGTLAGQPTDDGEMALSLARSLVREGRFDEAAVLDAYVNWLESSPFDVGATTSRALGAAARTPKGKARLKAAAQAVSTISQANGSLMRCSPLGIMGWRDPQLAADWARRDSKLTHSHPVCVEACAAFVAAIATAIGQSTDARGTYEAALTEARRGGNTAVMDALTAAAEAPPARFDGPDSGWVLLALQNAFHQLLHPPTYEEGVVATVSQGGDADTTGAICGALLGAVHGREAVPPRWRRAVLSCRPLRAAGARRPRPAQLWPVDALQLAERLLLACG